MGRIIDVREVQKELDRAARDAARGPRDVRAGRFVHGNGRGQASATDTHLTSSNEASPRRNGRPAR